MSLESLLNLRAMDNWAKRVIQFPTMITRFLTEVSAVFNPFSPKAKTARLFLAFLPSGARSSMKVETKLLPRTSKDKSFVTVKFSKNTSFPPYPPAKDTSPFRDVSPLPVSPWSVGFRHQFADTE